MTPDPVEPSMIRDPSDVAILGTAVAAKADLLVTGDKDLLVVKKFETFEIVSPREFLERFLR